MIVLCTLGLGFLVSLYVVMFYTLLQFLPLISGSLMLFKNYCKQYLLFRNSCTLHNSQQL